MYSLALVYWELASRCTAFGPNVAPYQMPYAERVSPDPSVEEMKTTVCDNGVRPVISNHWPGDEVRVCTHLRLLVTWSL